MKKIITIACAFLVIAFSATAQKSNKNNKHQAFQHKKQAMASKLGMSDDQKTKLKSINQSYVTSAKSIKNNEALTQGEAKKQLVALQQQRKTDASNVLTTDQKNIIAQEKQLHKKEIKDKQEAKFNKMKEKLALTNNQVSQLQKRKQEVSNNIAEIKGNTALTKAEQKQEIKALKQQQKQYIKTILTPEQLSKLKDKKARK